MRFSCYKIDRRSCLPIQWHCNSVPISFEPCSSNVSPATSFTSISPYCTTLGPEFLCKNLQPSWLCAVTNMSMCTRAAGSGGLVMCELLLHCSGCSPAGKIATQRKRCQFFHWCPIQQEHSIDVLFAQHQPGFYLHPSVKAQRLFPRQWREDIMLSVHKQ